MHEDCRVSAVEYQNGYDHFGSRVKATALNSREQQASLVDCIVSTPMQTEEVQEEEV